MNSLSWAATISRSSAASSKNTTERHTTRLCYRGVLYALSDLPTLQPSQQTRLVYRGVAHFGARPTYSFPSIPGHCRYRGVAY
ncbi:DUF4278 domain-containing protein [uncultured Cohaesibacter sp.]|uniref:DUF4278 domain-containing protein n=1 Tax=uncultured Cohaesibacter sp. TaxID=1002546 RepID=UPI0029C702B8|nr:DUF4278 domain-containing protein [uncultured Cohaesibacter sp.]